MLKEFWERNKRGHEKEVRVLLTNLREFEILPFVHGGVIGFAEGTGFHFFPRLAFWTPLRNLPRGDAYDVSPLVWVDDEQSQLALAISDNKLLLSPWACAVLKFVMEVTNGK